MEWNLFHQKYDQLWPLGEGKDGAFFSTGDLNKDGDDLHRCGWEGCLVVFFSDVNFKQFEQLPITSSTGRISLNPLIDDYDW